MMVMNKTELGTICANRWERGVAMGIYGKKNGVSLEINGDHLELRIDKSWAAENNVEIKILDTTEEFSKQ